jgi:hypothetical protein
MRILRAVRPSPAMVIAALALLVALAGTGYAAVTLPANSVGPRQLQNNAVTTSKVKNHSLLKVDFAPGQVSTGPRGPVGPPGPPGSAGARGPTGPAGPSGTAATKWALVGRDGNFVAGSPGIVVVSAGPGQYYVNFGSAVTGHAIVVSPAFRDGDPGFRGTVTAAICGSNGTTPVDAISCVNNNNTSTVFVIAANSANNAGQNHAFYIAVL